jgi:hypothetical protein
MCASATPSIRLDDFVKNKKLKRVDFIKIDTDGHEIDVLLGAKEILFNFRPIIVFECGHYLLKEKGHTPKDHLDFFQEFDYLLYNLKNDKKLDLDNILNEVPSLSTIDILAVPKVKGVSFS